jgi:hypothetical protein
VRLLVDEMEEVNGSYREAAARTPRVVIERRWFRWTLLVMVGWCIFWDGALAVAYWSAFVKHEPSTVAFSVFHFVAGVVATYATFCGLVNRTRITIARGILSVRHRPLPWRGAIDLPIADVEAFLVQPHPAGKGGTTYSLDARLSSGVYRTLLRGLDDERECTHIARLLSARLA